MTPLEGPKPTEIQEEIVVPRNVARGLGKGLSQMFDQPIQEILSVLPPSDLETHPLLREQIQQMGPALERIKALIDKLQAAKDVRLKPQVGSGEFVFSEETVGEEGPLEPEISIDPTLFQNLRRVLSDNIGNPLAIVVGGSEVAQSRSTSSIVKDAMGKVFSTSQTMSSRLDGIRNAHQLKIITDSEGNTRIEATPESSTA